MAFEEMVVAIVLVSIVGGIVSSFIKSRERIAIARAGSNDETQGRNYAALEERIQVLERLATDKRQQLKDEIDAL